MTRQPHDQFAKQYLEELLSPLGTVEISKEITDETRQIDIFFLPKANPKQIIGDLGLLGKIAMKTALIEPYRNSPTRIDVRNCLLKLLSVLAEQQRQAKRDNTSPKEDNFPFLWILAPSASPSLIDGFGARLELGWPVGVYWFPQSYRTAIIAINQLPVNSETLWLRLLGRGNTQNQAVRELLALSPRNSRRQNITELLVSWRVSVEIQNAIEEEDREVFMTLSQTYLEWKEATRREGLEEGRQEAQRGMIENLLRVRFGSLDDSFNRVIEGLLALPPGESSRLLLESSQDELRALFDPEESCPLT